MTNLEKMNELVGTKASKKEIASWAYVNRIFLNCLEDSQEFECMKHSVDHFIEQHGYSSDEHVNWDKFLDAEYVEVGESSE